MKTFLIILALTLFVGCGEDPEYKYEPLPECTCSNIIPQSYVVNLEFTDHEEKTRSFPYKVLWSLWSYNTIPDSLYRTKGVSRDGVYFYHSLNIPERGSNGLIEIEQVDGPKIFVDFKDIEVTTIPCRTKQLDAIAKKRLAYGKKWMSHRSEKCPLHSSEDI